ncbi:hypothetical protein V9T40_002535 [Parthenolecanium corni]|uniref:tRNA (uracil(54)-C(5))-methyltransferase n=1 Tax=Parthenolecanium corni TaxID=536013 RepID=A0AAN9TUP7_9HEMI
MEVTVKNENCASSIPPSDGCANTENDPFAYLERSSFTSEKFKIEIRGLPKFYGLNEFRKLLNKKLNLKSAKIKPPKRNAGWMYVCFRTEEDRQNAITVLDGYVWKNKTLTAQIASAVPDPLVQKRFENKRAEPKLFDDQMSSVDKLKQSTVPLWNVPYEEQLKLKMNNMRSILEQLGKELLHCNKMNSSVRNIVEKRCQQYSGLPCELVDIKYAPFEKIAKGYRNKCEFTIGIDDETGLKTVGFRFGSYVQGSTSVGSIAGLPHIPEEMCLVVKNFEQFIRASDLEVYNPENHCGFWKQLTVRLGTNTKQIMVIISTNIVDVSEENLEKVQSGIIEFFTQKSGKECNVTSLYLQKADYKSNIKSKDDTLQLLYGSSTIVEELCGLKFYISPSSFFQTNTAAAEVLYTAVNELTSLSEQITLLDICCGTGSIGLCLSKGGAQVLGIESEASAVENAKFNCEQNNIQNCTFFHGKAEDILSSVINKASNKEIVAVVDPPRSGLHQKAIIQLRRSKIQKLIYLSCNPKAALKNFVTFGKPPSKTLFGSQFLPVKAIPVDNFPHTNHCELILYLERFGGDDTESNTNNVSS